MSLYNTPLYGGDPEIILRVAEVGVGGGGGGGQRGGAKNTHVLGLAN